MLFKSTPPYSHDYLNRAEKYCSWAYMMVLTMVLIKMSFESVILSWFCDVVILLCMVGAGGYVLVNVFWLYIMKGMDILEKIKELKKNKEILRETLAQLNEFHQNLASSKTQNANFQKRRLGISLNLPARYI
jgi:Tfp pilus assembly protein PilO